MWWIVARQRRLDSRIKSRVYFIASTSLNVLQEIVGKAGKMAGATVVIEVIRINLHAVVYGDWFGSLTSMEPVSSEGMQQVTKWRWHVNKDVRLRLAVGIRKLGMWMLQLFNIINRKTDDVEECVASSMVQRLLEDAVRRKAKYNFQKVSQACWGLPRCQGPVGCSVGGHDGTESVDLT